MFVVNPTYISLAVYFQHILQSNVQVSVPTGVAILNAAASDFSQEPLDVFFAVLVSSTGLGLGLDLDLDAFNTLLKFFMGNNS